MESRYLYRGKRIDNGKWVEGSLVTGVFFRLGQEIPYMFCPNLADYDCFEDFSEENGIFEVDPSTICQCTGLKDKNGKLIWENDIMEAHLDDMFPEEVTRTRVVWDKNAWVTSTPGAVDRECLDDFDTKHFYVVGNIFDNPEEV
jgi:uncharacterized phage protein (TIGR01671 family)|nr:MAG TPA: YopX protein [Caudoviricetes sp.]